MTKVARQATQPENLGNFEVWKKWGLASLFNAIEHNSEGTVIVDADARVVWINERYAARFGFTGSNAEGQKVEQVIANSKMRQVVRSGNPILLDIMPTTSGPLVVMRLPIKSDDGRVLGAIGFALYDDLAAISPLHSVFSQMESELTRARNVLAFERKAKYTFDDIVGISPIVAKLKTKARRAAVFECPVLLTGETGAGKELLAHAIHGASLRAHCPLVSVNMGAIPETLMETEFFGVAPGAYTGAHKSGRPGKLELADGGTLFLDEIADLPYALQGKLLRVLQEKEYEAVGSNRIKRANVRLIAATSADLAELVKKNLFRADLYYRLNVVPLHMPPLRERMECLPVLVKNILSRIAHETKITCQNIDKEALDLLSRYSWPGNVRELRNVLERAAMFAETDTLRPDDLRPLLFNVNVARDVDKSAELQRTADASGYAEAMEQFETALLRKTLDNSGGDVCQAAKMLGIGRSTLYKKIKRHGLPFVWGRPR
jgi:transcriptional regulator with PAS, ATPase and Fis domain